MPRIEPTRRAGRHFRRMMRSGRRGGALLAVLWLAAALSAIAFSIANTVRGETERTATLVDSVRAYYLATGSIERALLHMLRGPGHRYPDGSPMYYERWMPFLRFSFPTGEAVVEIIPDSAKLNLNLAPKEELFRLFMALGAGPERSSAITEAIVDWRTPMPIGTVTPFDQYYLSLVPSFLSRHASFQEIEEVLLVRGMTPDLFYGIYDRDPEGRLVPLGGLKDCAHVMISAGTGTAVDVNTAHPAVLSAVGLSPVSVTRIVETRRVTPFRDPQQLANFGLGGEPAFQRLMVGAGGSTVFTLRATARLRLPDGKLSDLRRTVSARVKFPAKDRYPPYHILRWYDNDPASDRLLR